MKITHKRRIKGIIVNCSLLFQIIFVLSSCKKDFLDAKPNSSLVVPTSISDLQGLVDGPRSVNLLTAPLSGELGSDEYFVLQSNWSRLDIFSQQAYVWTPDVYSGLTTSDDWTEQYGAVLYYNLALDGINKIVPNQADQAAWGNVKGSALFYRAEAFWKLAQIFCKVYVAQTAATDLGIPLKLSSDVNAKAARATVQQTYSQILTDLKSSINLLPGKPLNNVLARPSKAAAFGLLARIYLSMSDYENARISADSSLSYNSTLLDFNQLNPYSYPYLIGGPQNVESSYSTIGSSSVATGSRGLVDTNLYNSYDANDLRKSMYFFKKTGHYYEYTCSYNFTNFYTGIATDEMLLTRAECYAREGNTQLAMNDLNHLLVTRWVTGTFVNYTATNATDALNQILIERRKELVWRYTRWTDLRRLNLDPNYAVTLTRVINGQTYTLPPNDPRYVYPIPPDEEKYNPMPQNDR